MSGSKPVLDGKRAVVTGMSKGLGQAIAVALARAGASVFGIARDNRGLADTANGIRGAGGTAEWLASDLANEDNIRRAVATAAEELGGIDILVNNAGVTHASSVLSTSSQTWDEVISLNLRTPFLLCREAGPHLLDGDGGKVINVVSVLAGVAVRDSSAYVASKAGLVGFTRALALEWALDNVQVNALAPGFLRTEMSEDVRPGDGASDWVVSRTPMKRWGEVDDLSGAAVFLASPASDFMTGQTVTVDGGWSAV